ncbi:hypothetical protein INR49_032667 [Caranx melampygus]|nr:hypothetical protein INR49_032667 [Caranx melampygus]
MPVLKPDTAQEPEQGGLPVKPEEILRPAVPPQADPDVLPPVAPPEEKAAEEVAEEPAEDLKVVMNQEDDLDLDSFDLDEIDTSDVNLDEELLSE